MTFASQKNTQAPDELDLIYASSFEFVPKATIVSVTTSGSSNNYTFNVGILSPDISCLQYADWWEVLDANGLVHRRILGHSHAGEQPFIRSSSPIQISPTQVVWIRAHMNIVGYGGEVFTGSVNQGFTSIPYENLWVASVEFEAPQVNSCAF
jgi:hypothetical protein